MTYPAVPHLSQLEARKEEAARMENNQYLNFKFYLLIYDVFYGLWNDVI